MYVVLERAAAMRCSRPTSFPTAGIPSKTHPLRAGSSPAASKAPGVERGDCQGGFGEDVTHLQERVKGLLGGESWLARRKQGKPGRLAKVRNSSGVLITDVIKFCESA